MSSAFAVFSPLSNLSAWYRSCQSLRSTPLIFCPDSDDLLNSAGISVSAATLPIGAEGIIKRKSPVWPSTSRADAVSQKLVLLMRVSFTSVPAYKVLKLNSSRLAAARSSALNSSESRNLPICVSAIVLTEESLDSDSAISFALNSFSPFELVSFPTPPLHSSKVEFPVLASTESASALSSLIDIGLSVVLRAAISLSADCASISYRSYILGEKVTIKFLTNLREEAKP